MKDFSIAAISVGATALGLGIWGFSSLGFSLSPAISPHHPDTRRMARELMLDRELDLSAGGQISIDVADGDVILRSHASDGARVRIYVETRDATWGRAVFDRMSFEIDGSGSRATIKAQEPNIGRDEWQEHRSFSVTVEVDVPRQVSAEVVTQDGDVRLGTLEGTVTVETMDGDIAIDRLDGTEITLRTQDGDIWAESLRAGAIALFTSDGDITITLVSAAETTLSSGDGDISINVGSFGSELDLRGEEVAIAPSAGFEGQRREGWARGQMHGGGPKITASTGDGDVSVRSRR
jgi:hypothetical protein